MKYTKKQFLEDVRHEATMLREHAKKEEKERLDFETFSPMHEDNCIYGQMAFNCRTDRAISLIKKCCIRFVKGGFNEDNWGSIMEHLNGKRVTTDQLDLYSSVNHFSAIEAYIMTPKAKNKNLIAYIKGEKDTLTL